MLASNLTRFESPNSVDSGDLPPSTPGRLIKADGRQVIGGGVGGYHHGCSGKRGSPSSFTSSSSSSSRGTSSTTTFDSDDSIEHSPPGARYHESFLPSSYNEDRRSSSRLLNDIRDIDCSPIKLSGEKLPLKDTNMDSSRPYDQYYAEDEFEHVLQSHDASGSLPSVEDARLYAANLLDRYEDKLRTSSSPSFIFHDDGKQTSIAVDVPSSSKRCMPVLLGKNHTIQLDSPSRREQRNEEWKRLYHQYFGFVILPCIALAAILLATIVVYPPKNNSLRIRVHGDKNTNADTPEIIEANSTRYFSTVQALMDWKISDEISLTTEDTPQNRAAHWIADIDLLRYDIPETRSEDSNDTPNTHFRFIQRYVLAVMYYSWYGEEWVHDLQWMTPTDECAWYKTSAIEIAWSQRSYVHGVTCHADLRVREIFLTKNGVRGKWVQEIQHLTNLEILSLSNNLLDGTLPTSTSRRKEDEMGIVWENLVNLQYLDLTYNGFYGALPEELGNLSELQVLALSDNAFSGTVPPTFASLHALRTLAIDDNLLTGTLEFATNLIDMEYFYADRNSLHAVLDDNFLAKHSHLRELDLSANLLECDDNGFPLHLLQHPSLRVLDLASNKLGGPFLQNNLSSMVTENTSLEFLSVHANDLKGTIPSALYNFKQLKHLDLQGNSFSGGIPNNFEFLTSLEYLFIGYNELDLGNTFPNVILSMLNLRELSLAGSQLESGIPHWLGERLTSLSLLDLSNNNMKGAIPASLWELPKLAYLFLDHNDFTGTIVDATPTTTLKVVMMHRNRLLSGNATELCDVSTDLVLLGLDCGSQWSCTDECCPKCCAIDDNKCFDIEEANYMVSVEGLWEYGFTRDTNGYDPYLLDKETGLILEKLAGEHSEAPQP